MTTPAKPQSVQRTIEAVWRIESPRLIGGLVRMLRDIGDAEDAAQNALVSALENWAKAGVPDNPGAWLMATAKNRAIDRLRREKLAQQKFDGLGDESEFTPVSLQSPSEAADDDIGDDLLRLIFVACHPILPAEARVALTLRLLGGLSTDEIARAFLLPEATIAQRIVRAKRTLAQQPVAFEVPRRAELSERLDSVLGVIYLIFNEGYAATSGSDWMRPGLCEEALRLGRVLAGLVPNESEVHALVALMEIQASRAGARVNGDGEPILLLEQNRSRWDRLLIRRGLIALKRAEQLGGSERPYALQAAIAACHARALRADDTDWALIATHYGTLAKVMPSPVVELNRAVACGMAYGAAAGLQLADQLVDEPALSRYHLLPAVRGDLLFKLGRRAQAREQFQLAASLTDNERERNLMRQRAAACSP
ncbi:MAG: RNA polymerase sigma factor [Dokdonella sp.]